MGMKLFLLRHGKTLWNLEGRYQGVSNTNLTKDGIQQAKLAAKYLSKVNFSGIYSSPLGRAIETSEIFKKVLKKGYMIRENLKEIDFGKWEGLKFDEINERYNSDYQNWLRDPYTYPPTDGESFISLTKRALQELKKISEENPDNSNILIISHGGLIVALLVYWLRIPAEKWSSIIQSHGALNIVYLDKSFTYISQINFTGHLYKYYNENSDNVIKSYSKIRTKG
ncbi:histidine phosphatase family protein [bacterium]|jgi:broad specificity phosphatase PhoE|nr:histidine phosphatase family protein [bacterium]